MIFKFTDNFIFFQKKIHQSFAEFKNCTTFASAIKQYGRLAQLVQSIWFTPRGSGVRIPQRPQKRFKRTSFSFYQLFHLSLRYPHSLTGMKVAKSQSTLLSIFWIVFQKVCKSFLFSLLQIYSFLIK